MSTDLLDAGPQEAAKRLTADDVCALIRAKWPDPEYAVMFEVRNGTGFQTTTRSADALVMGTWPSRGMHLHGMEVKISRSDWLRELKRPDKADVIASYCDLWSVVAANASIVAPGELPTGWGLFVPNKAGNRLDVVTTPKFNEAPKTIDRPFLGALLRACGSQNGAAKLVAEKTAVERQKLEKGFEDRVQHSIERSTQRHRELEKYVREFEEASGVNIRHTWDHGKIGNAVAALLARDDALDTVMRARDSLDRALKDAANA